MSKPSPDQLERLCAVFNRLQSEHRLPTYEKLGAALGYTKGGFSQIKNGTIPLAARFLNALKEFDQRINIDYITDNKGGVFTDDPIKLPVANGNTGEVYFSPLTANGDVDKVVRAADSAFPPHFLPHDLLLCKSTETDTLEAGKFYHFDIGKPLCSVVRMLGSTDGKAVVALDNGNDMQMCIPLSAVNNVYKVVGMIRNV